MIIFLKTQNLPPSTFNKTGPKLLPQLLPFRYSHTKENIEQVNSKYQCFNKNKNGK